MLFKNRHLLGEKKFEATPTKHGCWYLSGVIFEISDEYTRPFYMGVPPSPGVRLLCFRTGASRINRQCFKKGSNRNYSMLMKKSHLSFVKIVIYKNRT